MADTSDWRKDCVRERIIGIPRLAKALNETVRGHTSPLVYYLAEVWVGVNGDGL
jgi:hypothetical protein